MATKLQTSPEWRCSFTVIVETISEKPVGLKGSWLCTKCYMITVQVKVG